METKVTCIKCGAKIGEEYVICPYCSTDQETGTVQKPEVIKEESCISETQKESRRQSKTKYCHTCGEKIPQNAVTCSSCGASQVKRTTTESAVKPNSPNYNTQKIIGIGWIIIAVVSFVFAYQCFVMSTGLTPIYETYGGDAYTGIQNAAAATARNIELLNSNIITISSYIFGLFGLFSTLMGLKKIIIDSKLSSHKEDK